MRSITCRTWRSLMERGNFMSGKKLLNSQCLPKRDFFSSVCNLCLPFQLLNSVQATVFTLFQFSQENRVLVICQVSQLFSVDFLLVYWFSSVFRLLISFITNVRRCYCVSVFIFRNKPLLQMDTIWEKTQDWQTGFLNGQDTCCKTRQKT